MNRGRSSEPRYTEYFHDFRNVNRAVYVEIVADAAVFTREWTQVQRDDELIRSRLSPLNRGALQGAKVWHYRHKGDYRVAYRAIEGDPSYLLFLAIYHKTNQDGTLAWIATYLKRNGYR